MCCTSWRRWLMSHSYKSNWFCWIWKIEGWGEINPKDLRKCSKVCTFLESKLWICTTFGSILSLGRAAPCYQQSRSHWLLLVEVAQRDIKPVFDIYRSRSARFENSVGSKNDRIDSRRLRSIWTNDHLWPVSQTIYTHTQPTHTL